jgi:lysophospholipase
MSAPASSLARRRSFPAGGRFESRVMADGWRVRTALWEGRADGPGSLLFVTGRGDFLEKYCETFHDLVDAGWGVASFDWRGQGLSGRQGKTAMHGHSDGFENWLADLDALIGWFRASLPAPWHAMAHSMGGHLLQRHLAGENGEFERAVLLSPMFGVTARPIGAPMARKLARLMVRLGQGERFVPGGGPYVAGAAGSPRQLMLTSDPERYLDESWWVSQNPALALGSVTYGWLDAAFRSLDALLEPLAQLRGTGEGAESVPALQRIATPMLVLIPEADALVDNSATRRAVASMACARLEVIPGAAHELLREASGIRARVLARATAFLQNRE